LAKKKKYLIPWHEINTKPSWVLRELVDEVHCTFDDDDFADMLLELDKPFEEFYEEAFISDKDNLARDYPVKSENKSGWQEQNVTNGSLGLDAVDFVDFGDEYFEDMEKELMVEMKPAVVATLPLLLAPVLTDDETHEWMDINASFNDDLVRDEVKVDVTNQDLGADLDGLEAELSKEITMPSRDDCLLHSGYLMIKGRGLPEGEVSSDKWKKKFFTVIEKQHSLFTIDFFDKKGGVLQGSIPCQGSHVMSTEDKDDKHTIRVRSFSNGDALNWRLKASSAEVQYKWVTVFTTACSAVTEIEETDELNENQVDVIIEEETTVL